MKLLNKKTLLYIAPSIPVPGPVGGSTHILNISRLLSKNFNVIIIAKRLKNQKFFEVYKGLKIYRFYRLIIKPTSEISFNYNKHSNVIFSFFEAIYFNFVYSPIVILFSLYICRQCRVNFILERGDSYGVGAYLSKLLNLKLVTEVRDKFQDRLSLKLASLILTYNKGLVNKNYLFKTKIMYGGVDTKKFRSLPKNLKLYSKYKIPKNKKVVGYVGTFAPWHRVELIISIAKLNKNLIFLLVGPHYLNYKEIVLKEKIKNVIFTGAVDNSLVPKLINIMDICIALYDYSLKDETRKLLGSKNELPGPPYKVYEYLACKKPVIASYNNYVVKIINEDNGAVINTLDSLTLNYALKCLLNKKMFKFLSIRNWDSDTNLITKEFLSLRK